MNLGRRSATRAFLLTSAALASVLSCGISSGLLSDSERSSLYTLNINSPDGSNIADGVVLLPGTGISAIVAKKTSAGDPAALDFSLAGLDGAPVAALHFASSAAKGSAGGGTQQAGSPAASLSVARIDGKLDGFTIPAGLSQGAYALSVSLSGPDGSLLLQEQFHLFVGGSVPMINSVSAFPPAVEPGTSALLGLTVSWTSIPAPAAPASPAAAGTAAAPQESRDPWIRWSKDGASFAEGPLSAGLGKVVWSAPSAEGAYSITAEVFPVAPPKGSSFHFKAASSQDLKVMVIAAPGGSGNDFADSPAFYSLLRFDGSFDDIGTRPRSAQPKSFGSPILDTYSSGFGYRFGANAGVVIPGLMPPSASGMLGAFSVVLRLGADQTDGTLVGFASGDGSYRLVLGIKASKPYVDSTSGGKTLRSLASASIPGSPLTIAATFRPYDGKLAISWSAEGERIDAPYLPLPSAPPDGSATLGGPGSLPGVYDGFGLMVGSSLPFYRLAARRLWKAALIIAESFEDGALPPQSSPAGGVSAASGALELEPGGSLTLAPSFGITSALELEADIGGDQASCVLDVSTPEGSRVFSIQGTGTIADAAGKAIGSLDTAGGRIAFALELKEGSLYLRGAASKDPVLIPSSARRFVLSLARIGGSGEAAFDRVLVRSSARS
jgi:hypothetical protein